MSGRIIVRLRTRKLRMTCLSALWALLLLVFQVRSLAANDPNEQCLMCHEDQSLKNQAGHSLFVNNVSFEQSIHGKSGISCVSCHSDLESVKDFPHAETLAKVNCASCHEQAQKKLDASVHGQDFAKGVRDVPVCTDCHGEHQILSPQDKQSK